MLFLVGSVGSWDRDRLLANPIGLFSKLDIGKGCSSWDYGMQALLVDLVDPIGLFLVSELDIG